MTRGPAMKIILTAAALLASGTITIGHAHTHRTPACPAGYTCTSDPVDFIDQSQTADPQFIVSDPSNAPQFSVGTGGAASWANPLCITDNPLTTPPLRFVACIGGPWGNGQGRPLVTLYDAQGHAVSLTISDLRFLHALERVVGRHRHTP